MSRTKEDFSRKEERLPKDIQRKQKKQARRQITRVLNRIRSSEDAFEVEEALDEEIGLQSE